MMATRTNDRSAPPAPPARTGTSPLAMPAQRRTKQRSLVRDQLATETNFRSAQTVYTELRNRGESVGLSTVYRHLQALAESGEADVLQATDGESLYRLCGPTSGSHHHHLVCRSCGRTQEIEGRSVERWAAQTAETHGFVDVDHTVELVGLCRSCATGSTRSS